MERLQKLLSTAFSAVLVAGMMVLGGGAPASASEPPCPNYPSSDAQTLDVIANHSKRQSRAYWWEKTDLTVGVAHAPTVAPEQLAAVESAISTWQQVVEECLEGDVTLTYVPFEPGMRGQSDIIVHLVPLAGGSHFAGTAICSPAGCTNILVSYAAPPGQFKSPLGSEAPPDYTQGIALHEIGHALGLGHADNLWTGSDLMAYGWAVPDPSFTTPEISRCDIAQLRYVWSWALNGTSPARPAGTVFTCPR